MATVTLNPWFGHLRGSVGDLVFKRYGEQIVVTCKPDMSRVQWSAAQRAGRERFRQAAAYGKQVLADPVRRAEYAARAKELGKPIFSLVIADYYHQVPAQPQTGAGADGVRPNGVVDTNDEGENRTPDSQALIPDPSPFRGRENIPSPFRGRENIPSPFRGRENIPSPFGGGAGVRACVERQTLISTLKNTERSKTSMHILVTGGLGAVGRPVVQRLLTSGHAVRVLDRQSASGITNAEYLSEAEYSAGDVTDFNAVREAVRGMQAIIHLAALPNPAAGPGDEIFRINCSGTFNIYEAAAQEGIRRVVCASSINALGFNFGIKSFPIQYLPVDEAHPGFTTDPYSFSKQITEDIAAYYWRREGITGVQLRLPGVYHISDEFRAMVEKFMPITRQAYEKVLAMPAAEQAARARQVIAQQMEMRASRAFERPWEGEPPPEGEDWQPDLSDPLPLISFGYSDFWAMITGENSALAFERSVLAEYEGSHPLYVAEARNMLGLDAETLARIFFPETSARSRPLVGSEPLVSFDKARRLIGYEPQASMVSQL